MQPDPRYAHPWDVTPSEAIAIQKRLAAAVVTGDQLGTVRLVAGVDVGFEAGNTVTRAAVSVLTFPELRPVEEVLARRPTTFPYVPGLLSFREGPAILDALSRLATAPDLLLLDGQGLAHPRRFGIACHIGLLTGLPSIGVAKTRLRGQPREPLAAEKGSWVPLVDKDEVVGALVRSRREVRPLYVSIGHRVSLPTAIEYTLACTTRYRLPETTRAAHELASSHKP
jgi:deoxyribonuclease V